jgi:hypothetical protein
VPEISPPPKWANAGNVCKCELSNANSPKGHDLKISETCRITEMFFSGEFGHYFIFLSILHGFIGGYRDVAYRLQSLYLDQSHVPNHCLKTVSISDIC